MSLYLIAIIIFAGLILLLAEALVIPGFGVAGISGFALLGAGIYFAYSDHGPVVGHYFLGGTLAVSVVTAVFVFRSKTWRKMALNTTVDSKIENVDHEVVHAGDEGVCISRLNPMGKVRVNGHFFEAKSNGEFITEGTEVIVVKVIGNTLIVKTK